MKQTQPRSSNSVITAKTRGAAAGSCAAWVSEAIFCSGELIRSSMAEIVSKLCLCFEDEYLRKYDCSVGSQLNDNGQETLENYFWIIPGMCPVVF